MTVNDDDRPYPRLDIRPLGSAYGSEIRSVAVAGRQHHRQCLVSVVGRAAIAPRPDCVWITPIATPARWFCPEGVNPPVRTPMTPGGAAWVVTRADHRYERRAAFVDVCVVHPWRSVTAPVRSAAANARPKGRLPMF